MSSPRVRPLERRDALSVAALRIQLDRSLGCAPRAGFLQAYADSLLAEWSSHRGWLAEAEDGRPVGVLLVRRWSALPTLASPARADTWVVELEHVAADADGAAVRAGLGSALEEERRRVGAVLRPS